MAEPQEQAKRARLRKALLDQLQYLVVEVESLKGVVGRVPEELQEGRPLPEDLSIKEMYGLLAVLDETVHLPFVRRIVDGQTPEIGEVHKRSLALERGWNERAIEDILERVQQARQELIGLLEDLPAEAWQAQGTIYGEERDLFELAHYITQHDVERLREMGYRLHESHMPPAEKEQ